MSNGITYSGPINPNPGPGEARIIIYSYIPSLALGVIGLVTFAIIFGINVFYLVKPPRPRSSHANPSNSDAASRLKANGGSRGLRSFHILLLVGAAMEAGGYGVRIASHYRPFVVATFVAQYFLIVVVSPRVCLARNGWPGDIDLGGVRMATHHYSAVERSTSQCSPVNGQKVPVRADNQAPVLFSAAIYLSLTLLVRSFHGAERLLILRPKLVLACKYRVARGSYDHS